MTLLLVIGFGPAGAGPAAAADAVDAARAAALAFVRAETAVPDGARLVLAPGRLDSRLKLADCGRALEVSDLPGARPYGRRSVAVRCEGPESWLLYVPVQVDLHGAAVVSTRSLRRGERLGAEDLRVEDRDLASLARGHFPAPEALIGRLLRSGLAAGQPLTPGVLQPEGLIRTGAAVTLESGGGGISVRVRGIALADAALGQRIPVRNLSSQQIVSGVVTGPNLIRVGP